MARSALGPGLALRETERKLAFRHVGGSIDTLWRHVNSKRRNNLRRQTSQVVREKFSLALLSRRFIIVNTNLFAMFHICALKMTTNAMQLAWAEKESESLRNCNSFMLILWRRLPDYSIRKSDWLICLFILVGVDAAGGCDVTCFAFGYWSKDLWEVKNVGLSGWLQNINFWLHEHNSLRSTISISDCSPTSTSPNS